MECRSNPENTPGWHDAEEWALMLSGKARPTALDDEGRSYVKDVAVNDLWYFPSGNPHSIQGLGPEGCEFLLVFDDGKFSEGNRTLISDWVQHTPKEILAKNWGVPESALNGVCSLPPDGCYIFQLAVPGPLEQDRADAAGPKGSSPTAFDFPLHAMAPTIQSGSGEIRIIDSRNFPVSTTIAAAHHVIMKPGALREPHWHQNADEWQYYVQAQGRMTVFFNGGKARTTDFAEGDVGYVPKTFGHCIENTGGTDLIFLELFKASRFQSLTLSEWVRNTPPRVGDATLSDQPGNLAGHSEEPGGRHAHLRKHEEHGGKSKRASRSLRRHPRPNARTRL